MTDDEDKKSMQANHEASLGCLNTKASHFSSRNCVRAMEDFPRIKDGKFKDPAFFFGSGYSVIREVSGAIYLGYPSPFYRQENLLWPSFYTDVLKLQQGHVNTFVNQLYPINQEYACPGDNRIQFVPFNMLPQGYPHVQFQEFQYFVVIDFEATCDKDMNPHPQEIIEFPSVLVNSLTGDLEACFQTYVRPAHHPILTDFCKELTGIQQIQVDRGVSLSEALLMHDKWLEEKGIKQQNFAVVTWSNWDCRVILESECRLKGIRKPHYFNRWINLKVPFQEVFGGIRCNLKQAVQLAGLAWEGRAHCGLDDACNTARLLALIMCQGFRFSITNSLTCHSTECSFPDGRLNSVHQFEKPKEQTGQALQFQPSMYINPKN